MVLQELLNVVPRGDVMAGAVMAGAVIAEMRSMIVIVRGGSGCRERWPSWSWVWSCRNCRSSGGNRSGGW